jgi:hypothetical protein
MKTAARRFFLFAPIATGGFSEKRNAHLQLIGADVRLFAPNFVWNCTKQAFMVDSSQSKPLARAKA